MLIVANTVQKIFTKNEESVYAIGIYYILSECVLQRLLSDFGCKKN